MIWTEVKRLKSSIGDPVIIKGWKFSEEEVKQFGKVLSKFEPKQVKSFISAIESHCREVKKHFLDRPTEKEFADQLNDIVRSLRRSSDYLKYFIGGKIFIGTQLIDLEDNPSKRVQDRLIDCQGLDVIAAIMAPSLRKHIEEFVGYIENDLSMIKLKQGRRNADQFKLVRCMSKSFSEYLGKPSSTKDGPFVSVVQIAFNALEIPIEYPDRAIRSALKELNSPEAV